MSSSSPPHTSDPRLDGLERALHALEARVAALESGAPEHGAAAAGPLEPTPLEIAAPSAALDTESILTLVGRTLMVLGGAYLLRALTESAIWSPAVGVAIGFAYAAAWLGVADRTAPRLSGVFHGATAVMIALPLLWESVTRFHTLGPWAAGIVLLVVTGAALAVAVRRRLQTLAWIGVIGALASSLALTAATSAVLPFAIVDVVLGVGTLWIGYTIDWVWLRWPAALVADLAVLALAAGIASNTAVDRPSTIVAAQLLLLSGYLASIAVRTLARGREVLVFEALQSTVALAVGFGGAVFVAQTTGTGAALLIAIALVCGAGSYAVAFAFVMRRQGVRLNFFFYTSVALVLLLAGSAIGLPEPAIWWAAAAVACAALARRERKRADGHGYQSASLLTAHAATYLCAAALTSGLAGAVIHALMGAATAQAPFAPRWIAVFAAASICWLAAPPPGARDGANAGALARAVMGLIVAASSAAWVATLALSDQTAPGVAAAVRTGTLAATALALAWIGRTPRLREAAWLVYPTLALGAVKLVVEDFPKSSAAALFVALATYGGALIAAPRIARKAQAPPTRTAARADEQEYSG
jgi:hypothetical protein